jgi:hypothetical protein
MGALSVQGSLLGDLFVREIPPSNGPTGIDLPEYMKRHKLIARKHPAEVFTTDLSRVR